MIGNLSQWGVDGHLSVLFKQREIVVVGNCGSIGDTFAVWLMISAWMCVQMVTNFESFSSSFQVRSLCLQHLEAIRPDRKSLYRNTSKSGH